MESVESISMEKQKQMEMEMEMGKREVGALFKWMFLLSSSPSSDKSNEEQSSYRRRHDTCRGATQHIDCFCQDTTLLL